MSGRDMMQNLGKDILVKLRDRVVAGGGCRGGNTDCGGRDPMSVAVLLAFTLGLALVALRVYSRAMQSAAMWHMVGSRRPVGPPTPRPLRTSGVRTLGTGSTRQHNTSATTSGYRPTYHTYRGRDMICVTAT